MRRLTWNLFSRLVKFLHTWDLCSSQNFCANLPILWLKALSGNCVGLSSFDDFITHDLLPSIARWFVSFPLCYLFPPLHHRHVYERTRFLDNEFKSEIARLGKYRYADDLLNNHSTTGSQNVQVISLGGGFDSRSMRFLNGRQNRKFLSNHGISICCHEVDLPAVIAQKSCMLQRFLSRRPGSQLPVLHSADLNIAEEVKKCLKRIYTGDSDSSKRSLTSNTDAHKKHTIYLIEAVLVYLKKECVPSLLRTCIEESIDSGHSVSICFTDMYPLVEDATDYRMEMEHVQNLLKDVHPQLQLTKYRKYPIFNFHMGVARVM